MDARALDAVVLHEGLLFLELVLVAAFAVVDAHELGREVGKREEVLVLHVADEVLDALLGELDLVLLLVDDKEELRIGLVHLPLVVREVVALGLEELLAHAVLAEELDEGLALGQRTVRAVQSQTTFLHLFLGRAVHQLLLGFGQEPLGGLLLHLDQTHHLGLELVEFVLVALGRRSADDERRPRLVNEDRVNLVHDREVVLSLHELLRPHGHVVAQVVKAKLVVRAKRHVALVRLTTRLAVGLVLVNAVDGEAVEFVERPHPLGVATREVVVDGHHVDAAAREGVQEDGQRGHQGLAFPRLHLGRLAAVKGHPSDELHVVVHHVPRHRRSGSRPRLLPVGLVAFDGHEVAVGRNLAVHVCRRHLHGAFGSKTAGRLLHEGKRLGHDVGQDFFNALVDLKLEGIDLLKQRFLLVELRQGQVCGLGLKVFDLLELARHMVLDAAAEFCRLGAQVVCAQSGQRRFDFLHPIHHRLNLLDVVGRFVPDKGLEKLR